MRFAAASAVFALPLVRDVYLALGCVEASRQTLRGVLAADHALAILPGGEAEQLLVPDVEDRVEDCVEPRDGLFRLALEARAPILPAFAFGERDAYTASAFGLEARLAWSRRYRVGVPCAWGRHWWCPPVLYRYTESFFSLAPGHGACQVPRRGPVTIVVGRAVAAPPAAARDAVAEYKRRYRAAVADLFAAHKHAVPGDYGHRRLRWLPLLPDVKH